MEPHLVHDELCTVYSPSEREIAEHVRQEIDRAPVRPPDLGHVHLVMLEEGSVLATWSTWSPGGSGMDGDSLTIPNLTFEVLGGIDGNGSEVEHAMLWIRADEPSPRTAVPAYSLPLGLAQAERD